MAAASKRAAFQAGTVAAGARHGGEDAVVIPAGGFSGTRKFIPCSWSTGQRSNDLIQAFPSHPLALVVRETSGSSYHDLSLSGISAKRKTTQPKRRPLTIAQG